MHGITGMGVFCHSREMLALDLTGDGNPGPVPRNLGGLDSRVRGNDMLAVPSLRHNLNSNLGNDFSHRNLARRTNLGMSNSHDTNPPILHPLFHRVAAGYVRRHRLDHPRVGADRNQDAGRNRISRCEAGPSLEKQCPDDERNNLGSRVPFKGPPAGNSGKIINE